MKHPEYDSPLVLNVSDIATQMAEKLDETSWRVVQRVGINVDKDKMLAALKQDAERYRNAYAHGYDTGYQERDEEIVRCEDCKHYKDGFCYNPNTFDDEKTCGNTTPDWYCADGKRRDEDD